MSLCGRRRESLVSTHFEYNDSTNISTCKVMGQNGSCCLKKLTGKNPSNLKRHLESFHPKTYAEIEKGELHYGLQKSDTRRTVNQHLIDLENRNLLRLSGPA